MILVDIGNSGLRASRVELGKLFPQENVYRLSWSAAVASLRKPTPEQEAAPNLRWCNLEDTSAFDWLVSQFSDWKNEPWLVSSVQRHAMEKLRSSLNAFCPNASLHAVTYADVPLKIDVLSPGKTGIDRLLAAHCAYQHVHQHECVRGPVVVVQAGTAVTVDLVSGEGVFLGGSIMPGLGLSLQLLAAGTDLLPWLGNHAVDVWPTLPGKNTEQAISAGVNAALVGGVSHLVERYRRDMSSSFEELKVIVSGGDGQLLLPHIKQPVEFVEHAVLRGLSYLQCSLG